MSSRVCMPWRKLQNHVLAEACGILAPQRVTVPYAKARDLPETFLSRTVPVKRGPNLGGPPSKAKYSLVTDSGLVP